MSIVQHEANQKCAEIRNNYKSYYYCCYSAQSQSTKWILCCYPHATSSLFMKWRSIYWSLGFRVLLCVVLCDIFCLLIRRLNVCFVSIFVLRSSFHLLYMCNNFIFLNDLQCSIRLSIYLTCLTSKIVAQKCRLCALDSLTIYGT